MFVGWLGDGWSGFGEALLEQLTPNATETPLGPVGEPGNILLMGMDEAQR